MNQDATLAGYLELHGRPPAFAGSDGAAYSADIYVDDEADADGRFGGAILFVRWSADGARPTGHLETPYVAFGSSPEDVRTRVGALTLYDVKGHLEHAIAAAPERSWNSEA